MGAPPIRHGQDRSCPYKAGRVMENAPVNPPLESAGLYGVRVAESTGILGRFKNKRESGRVSEPTCGGPLVYLRWKLECRAGTWCEEGSRIQYENDLEAVGSVPAIGSTIPPGGKGWKLRPANLQPRLLCFICSGHLAAAAGNQLRARLDQSPACEAAGTRCLDWWLARL